jgi:hypothetical protein
MVRDPTRSDEEPAHDVLAAEAFAVPAADPGLRRPAQLPDDPSGIAEPHDILAAEEFAMPVGRPATGPAARRGSDVGRRATVAAGALGMLALLRRRRRRRRFT